VKKKGLKLYANHPHLARLDNNMTKNNNIKIMMSQKIGKWLQINLLLHRRHPTTAVTTAQHDEVHWYSTPLPSSQSHFHQA
jgi:hypothetical protein